MRIVRLLAVFAAAWLMREAHQQADAFGSTDAITLADARAIFPESTAFGGYDHDLRARSVVDRDGHVLGFVLRTAPDSDFVVGYSGSADVLLGIGPDGRIRGARILSSGDTPAHVDEVRNADGFWQSLRGWAPLTDHLSDVDAVSGSTLTCAAIVESIPLRVRGSLRSLRFRPVRDEVLKGAFGASELGPLWRTSPDSDGVVGYRGPTDVWVELTPDGERLKRVVLLSSYDTEEYVDRVRESREFEAELTARSVEEWKSLDLAEAGIEGVSGATQTSYAVAESIRVRAKRDEKWEASRSDWIRDLVVLVIAVLGCWLMFASPTRRRAWRRVWQVVIVGAFGIVLGDLLSVAWFVGEARYAGASPTISLGITGLAAIALAVPWWTGRQVYCAHLCPHGVVQEWVGRLRFAKWTLSPALYRGLRALPFASLCVAVTIACAWPAFDLTAIEPFHAWIFGTAAVASLSIAVVGVLLSPFVPMAYCRFGCPTGALFGFVRRGRAQDRFDRRDWAVVGLLVIGGSIALARHDVARLELAGRAEASGFAVGVPWEVDASFSRDVRLDLIARSREIDQACSVSRSDSEAGVFTRGETTLPIEVSDDLWAVVQRRDEWPGIEVDPEHRTLRKVAEDVRFDPSDAAHEFLADELVRILEREGVSPYGVRVGDVVRKSGT